MLKFQIKIKGTSAACLNLSCFCTNCFLALIGHHSPLKLYRGQTIFLKVGLIYSVTDVCNSSYKKMATFNSSVCQNYLFFSFSLPFFALFLYSTQTIVVHRTGHCKDESLFNVWNNEVEKLNIVSWRNSQTGEKENEKKKMRKRNRHDRKKIKSLPAEECNIYFMILNNRDSTSSLTRMKNKTRHYFE